MASAISLAKRQMRDVLFYLPPKTKHQVIKGLGLKLRTAEELETRHSFQSIFSNRRYKPRDPQSPAVKKRSLFHGGGCVFQFKDGGLLIHEKFPVPCCKSVDHFYSL